MILNRKRRWLLLAICASTLWAQNSPKTLGERQSRLWLDLKKSLSASDGLEYFRLSVLSASIPGGAYGLHSLKGTVVSSGVVGTAHKILVAMSDKDTPEVTLKLDRPPAASVRIRQGTVVEFEGIGLAFTQSPFMLTLAVSACKQVDNEAGLRCEIETSR